MRFLILMTLLVLTACDAMGPATVTRTYVPPTTPGGRLCVNECATAKEYCNQSCTFKFRQCVEDVQTQAMQDYERYTRDQFKAHQPIELHASDFERTSACDGIKKECADVCENHYRSCYGNCGGEVKETTSCTSFCF